ncbi:MAG: anti-sigma factor [Flavobacteriaceae bacterium]|nr:anti-sigma factor [Flavobacteriaceae bacterium]|tara:strand:- start:33835 stop:34737 length:903 start_codon:yes stop_codon:yes gene_type:complete
MDKNYLIEKWLNNDLTAEEQKAFDALEDNAFLKEIIQEGQRFKGQNPSKVAAFENLEKEIVDEPKNTTSWTNIFLKVAAVFVIAFGLYFLLDKDQHNTFETQLAQTEQITLPDNSMVTLNELSQLDFDDDWTTERTVQLKGEAYFKVAKGKRFDVKTEFGTVSVLGTQFNVKAQDSIFSIICYEGLVQVNYNNTTTKLSAGNACRVINGKPEAFNVAVIQPEWLQNMKVFKEASIKDVFVAIEKYYTVKIVTDSIDNTILFTGAFELGNLENALKATTKSLNLTYEINSKNEVVIKNAKE